MRPRLYYDLVCPYSYLESALVDRCGDAVVEALDWLPYELRPAPAPLLEVRGDHLRVDWTRNVYRLAQELGVEIHLPRFQPRTTLPLAACEWAREQGALAPFRRALYEAFFCEGLDITDEHELRRAAVAAGLSPDGAVAAAHDPERIARIAEIRHEAQAAGVRGVPALLDGERAEWGLGATASIRASLVP